MAAGEKKKKLSKALTGLLAGDTVSENLTEGAKEIKNDMESFARFSIYCFSRLTISLRRWTVGGGLIASEMDRRKE